MTGAALFSFVPPALIVAAIIDAANQDPGRVTIQVPPTHRAGHPTSATVHLTVAGRTYYCSSDASNRLKQLEQPVALLKYEQAARGRHLGQINAKLARLSAKYPTHTAPVLVGNEYNHLVAEGKRLMTTYNRDANEFNRDVDRYNAYLKHHCN